VELHVKILGGLCIALGIMAGIAALLVLVIFGGLAAVTGADGDPDAPAFIAMFGLMGTIGFVLMMLVSIPTVIAGFGLLNFRPWAQTLTIVIAVLNLFSFPFGTAIGIYGLWVLLNARTKPLFKTASGTV
jgi:hypothetical protein